MCLYGGIVPYYDSSYNGLVSGGRSEAGTAHIQVMVRAYRSGYLGDKGGVCSSGGGGGDRDGRIGGRGRGIVG